MAKKNEGRFNIEFDLNDPREKKAVQMLNSSKRKASLVANALCFYEHYGADMLADLVKSNESRVIPAQLQKDSITGTMQVPAEESADAVPPLKIHPSTESDIWDNVNESIDTLF